MITKAELEKMVKDEASEFSTKQSFTYASDWSEIEDIFKSGCSYVTGILMPEIEHLQRQLSDERSGVQDQSLEKHLRWEISKLQDKLYHATRSKADSEYLLNHELSTLTAKVKRYQEALEFCAEQVIWHDEKNQDVILTYGYCVNRAREALKGTE